MSKNHSLRLKFNFDHKHHLPHVPSVVLDPIRLKLLPPEFAPLVLPLKHKQFKHSIKHICVKSKHELESLGRNNQAFTITIIFFKLYFAYFFLDLCALVFTSYPNSHKQFACQSVEEEENQHRKHQNGVQRVGIS